jgi:hypothetical protein
MTQNAPDLRKMKAPELLAHAETGREQAVEAGLELLRRKRTAPTRNKAGRRRSGSSEAQELRRPTKSGPWTRR